MKNKNKKFIIIGSFIFAILVMAVGYSAFATQLLVSGVAEITGKWNVEIVDVEAVEVSDGCNAGTPQFTPTTVNFEAFLEKPGDSINYVITIQNNGTINAVLDEVYFMSEDTESDAIQFETTNLSKNLEAGNTTTVTVKITYMQDTEEIPSVKTKKITGVINYVQG